MKNLIALSLVIALAGCVATTGGTVSVRPIPEVQIAYHWDSHYSRYYRVERGSRYYMPPGWHDRRHPHGGPPGQKKKHKHKDKDRYR